MSGFDLRSAVVPHHRPENRSSAQIAEGAHHLRHGRDNVDPASQNGGMIMTEPQVWTLIGVFAAVMLGGMTLMTTLLTRTISAKSDAADSRIETLRVEMNARFDTMDVKFSTLDREVATLAERFWRS
jgi:hypothetical protein